MPLIWEATIFIRLFASQEILAVSLVGQEFRLAEAEEAMLSKYCLADPEQDKPALVVGHNFEEHAAEILKAADKFISKVLDWFKRRFSTSDRETVLVTSQERPFAEEMDAPRSVERSSIGEDKGSNTDLLNLKSSLHQRGESTSKDIRPQGVIKPPGQLSFWEKESPRDVTLGDRPPLNQSKGNENATSPNIHITKRPHFQTVDRREEKMDENNPRDLREDAFEGQTYVDLENSFRTGMKRETSSQMYTDGERDVKSFLEEENIELQSGETPKDPKGKDCNFLDAENTAHANDRSNLVLQQRELRQPPVIGDKKKARDIKAFWESGKMTPELGNKDVLTNENMSNYTKEYGRLKQVSGSSGYITSESDNEQSKYNLVTFRKVELSEEDSEMEDDEVKFSGTSEPRPGDKTTETQDLNIANEVLSKDQKNTNVPGLLNESNLQLSCKETASFQESERPKVTSLEKETILPALQPESPFKIHSLKGKMDEDSRSQMLDPSQFHSLRNVWDTGSKPQSKIDETIPQKLKTSAGSYTKESEERIGSSRALLDDGRSAFPLPGQETKKPTTKISPQSPLAEPMFSPSATHGPMRLDYGPIRDKDSSPVLPEKEHVGIKMVSPEIQRNVVHSSFQPTALVEELQESACPPRHDKGMPRVELVGKDAMAPHDQIPEPSFVLPDTNRNAGLKTNEVVEIVNRTLVPPKAAASNAFNTSLEKLLKETSDLQASLGHHFIMDVSPPADPTSEKRGFFNKVMERSHPSYPGDPKEIPSQTEGIIEKQDLLQTQPAEFTASVGSLPPSLEGLKPLSMKVSPKEDGQMYLNDHPAGEKNLLLPSVELIQPASCGVAQNRRDSPKEEVFEMVSRNNVPPNRECSDLNAKLISLLKESATCPSPRDILKTPFDDIPNNNQQKSYRQRNEKEEFASPQMSSHLRETAGEIVVGSKDTSKDDNGKIATQDGTTEATKEYADPKERIQGEFAGEQPLDQTETAVKTIKSKAGDRAAFRANLKQILHEDSTGLLGDIDVPKLAQSTLQPDPSVSSVCAKDTLEIQEVIESVEKSAAPSDSRKVKFKARFQTLLRENSAILPRSQKTPESSNQMQINKKPAEDRGFISQGVEKVSKIANKISAPFRFQQSELNSILQKLLEKAAQASSSRCLNLPQEETIMKSVAPAKEDRALKSNVEELILEHFDPASQPPAVDCKKVTGDSTADLDERKLPVRTSTLKKTVPSDCRSELKIPLTEKASKETDEGARISENTAFQKIIHLNLVSSETPCLEKEKGFPSTADKTEDRSMQEKETDFSTSLMDANRSLVVEYGLPISSIPLYGISVRPKEVVLHRAAPPADDDDDDGDAKNCESGFSGENKSIPGGQRDPLREHLKIISFLSGSVL